MQPDGPEQRHAAFEERSQRDADRLDIFEREDEFKRHRRDEVLEQDHVNQLLVGARHFAMVAFACVLMVLGGCATCRDHPVACTVAGTIIVGSIATVAYNYSQHDRRSAPPTCDPVLVKKGIIGSCQIFGAP